MSIEEGPPGQRLSRLRFYVMTQKASKGLVEHHHECCEYTLGPTGSGERIVNLWCDITPDFVTVTLIVVPLGHLSDTARAAKELIALVTSTAPKKLLKKGANTGRSRSQSDDERESAKAADILSQMAANVNCIQQRQVIFKVAEITGSIEMTIYSKPIKLSDFEKTI